MTQIVTLEQINEVLQKINPIEEIEKGFIAYSKGNVIVPPVGELIFDDPPGEVHIKYGYIKKDDFFVIKIASGYYNNVNIGLPSYSGLMLLFNQKTGQLISVLLDEGHLTNVRTAAAGAVVAKYLAPKEVKRIGIFGPGIQGRMQLEYLKKVVNCNDVIVCGIYDNELADYKKEMTAFGFTVETTKNSEDVTSTCNLIVTCTPAKSPIILAKQVLKGTHITAMGSDTADKQELDSAILKKADRVVADSIEQVLTRGECHHAIKDDMITKQDLLELGEVIQNPDLQRQTDDEITIADLTGVAVQDIQITKAVWKALKQENKS
ncbi:MAG: ornithine cyclodeaminase family protein [Asgard group archaeon]|nr:ornithine cyclodeaminase family protein [Asgard group archaeon]